MVDYWGRWTPEEDYTLYPKEEWCDMDYLANYIQEQKYIPKTSVENLATMVLLHFECETEDEDSMFLPEYAENLMLDMDSIDSFIKASGGLEEFDYIA